jgi:hypothetical protein
MEYFLRPEFWPRPWNGGILQGWFLKDKYQFFYFIVSTNFTIDPILHYSGTPHSTVPAFQLVRSP